MFKIIFNSNDLKRVVSVMGKVVSTNNITAILECLLLSVKDGRATFVGNDLQTAISMTIDCQASGQLMVAVPIGDLKDMVDIAGTGTEVHVDVDMKESGTVGGPTAPVFTLHVKIGKGKYTYPAHDGILFPNPIPKEDSQAVPMDTDLVMSMIAAYDFCGMDPVRPWSAAIALIRDGDDVIAMGSGHAGLYKSKGYDMDTNGSRLLMFPRKAIDIIDTFPSKAGLELLVPNEAGSGNAGIRQGDVVFYSRLIEGTYPDYKSIWPVDYERSFCFNADELLKEVRNVSKGAALEGPKGTITLKVTGLNMQITGENYENGKSGTSSIELVSTKDGDIEVLFATTTLINHLSYLTGVGTITHNGRREACFLAYDESESATHLIMPSMHI